MANTTPIFPGTVKTSGVSIVAADASTDKTLVTAGANGTRIDAISVSSTDTTDRAVQIRLSDGTTAHILGTVTIPTGSGNTAAVLPVALLSSLALPWLDASGSLFVANGWTLLVKATSTVASGALYIVAFSGDY